MQNTIILCIAKQILMQAVPHVRALHSITIDRYLRCLGQGQENSAHRYKRLLMSLHYFLPKTEYLDAEKNIKVDTNQMCSIKN